MLSKTSTIPIVMFNSADPVAAGHNDLRKLEAPFNNSPRWLWSAFPKI